MKNFLNPILNPIVLTCTCLLILFGVSGFWMVKHAPKLMLLKSVTIQPDGRDITLGHQELAQHPGAKSAESAHLNISLQPDGFYINNVAQYKKVDAKSTTRDTILLKRKILYKND